MQELGIDTVSNSPYGLVGPKGLPHQVTKRLHDAFEEAGRRLLATGDLPDHAGLPCQLIITLSLTDLERRLAAL